jgi:hypothetical protein
MQNRTVIVASQRQDLVATLSDAGFRVVGPVTTASMALVLASHAHADLALVDERLTGRRMGPELAAELYETWGVRSVLLGDLLDQPPEQERTAPWAAPDSDAQHLRRILSEDGLAA